MVSQAHRVARIQAKISTDQANAAALAKFPGATIVKTELDDENGKAVYSVQLTDSAGKAMDVKVDATTGTVVNAERTIRRDPTLQVGPSWASRTTDRLRRAGP